MVVEGGAGVGQVVHLHGPRSYGVVGLAHRLDVVGRRGGHEEVVGDGIGVRIGGQARVVLALQLDERVHAQLAHVVEAAAEELGGLLLGKNAAALAREARLHHARDGGLAENQQSVLFRRHVNPFFDTQSFLETQLNGSSESRRSHGMAL